jgi:hypothetical protein
MNTDYPENLLNREPAPPYEGEGPFALWHFSEDPSLGQFLPRDCPRGCIWPVSTTTAEDRERFFGQCGTDRVHVIEADWLERVRSCRLYAYRLPASSSARTR